MIVDFRYHVATLVGIFISLGLGILIGILLTGDKGMIDEQFQLTEELRIQLKGVRAENSLLKEEMTKYQENLSVLEDTFWEVSAALVANRLHDQRIGVLTLGKSPAWSKIEKSIDAAGGRLTTLVDVSAEWSASPDAMAQAICDALSTGKGSEGIRVSRFAEAFDVLVVLLNYDTKEKSRWHSLQGELARALKTLAVPVVVACPLGFDPEHVALWSGYPVIFLDGIDTLLGQLALVHSLQQGQGVSMGLVDAGGVAKEMLAEFLLGNR
ncbi:MAG: copper transporter [Limnochordia bacterium]|jgi:hypothetical protein|nr:copper transporter [Limnochordia bacterium]MDD2630460.1 copper transporter [Limnochordia bacterium]MDD4518486.1 copper transporter [Limnochordia bacterium]